MRLSRPRGMSLLSVLITAALLGIVMIGFLQFMKSASRAQGNLQKQGEAVSLDIAIRSILVNNRACVATAGQIPVTGSGLTPGVSHPNAIIDPAGAPVFRKGEIYNGLILEDIVATAHAPDRGVQLVQYHVLLRKVGATKDIASVGGRDNYQYDYFVNVLLTPAGAIDRCFTGSDKDGSLTLLGVERVGINFAGGLCGCVNNGCPTSPFQGAYDTLNIPIPGAICGDLTGATCVGKRENNSAGFFKALGNFTTLDFSGDLAIGFGAVSGCPAMTGVFAATQYAQVYDPSGTLIADTAVGTFQFNANSAASGPPTQQGESFVHRQIGLHAETVIMNTTANAIYRLGTRVTALSSSTTAIACGPYVTIHHYLQNNL